MNQPAILKDLAVVVTGAAGAAAIAPRLKIPTLPAYLLTGVLMGAIHRWHPFLGDVDTVAGLSNLGVTFLMFAMGLEFDFAKARPLFVPAVLAVVLQIPVMAALGAAGGAALGLGRTEGLFLGGLLTISSTMVSASTLKALGHTERNYGRLTIAVIVLEDIAAIVLLALLAGLGGAHATGHDGEHSGILNTLFLVGAFMTVLFAGGRLVLRRWLPTMGLEKHPEALAVVVGGLVLGVGLFSEKFGASPALAVFTLGAALAQTRVATHIGHVAEPFRNLFSAVFFVTLGISVRPELLWEVAPVAIPLGLAMIAFKAGAYAFGAFLGGQKPASSLRMALVNAHIGEFSFVIAGIGQATGVTGERVTAVVSGAALLSIMANRPIVNASDRIIAALAGRTPAGLRQAGDFYNNLIATTAARFSGATLWRVLRTPLSRAGFLLLFFFSTLGCGHLVCRHLIRSDDALLLAGVWLAASAVAFGFVIALARNLEATLMILAESVFPDAHLSPRRARALSLVTRLAQAGCVIFLGLVTLAFALPWNPHAGLFTLGFLALCAVAWFFRNAFAGAQNRFERLLMESFAAAGAPADAGEKSRIQKLVRRHKWPLHLRELRVAPHTRAAGRRLSELDVRAATGAFVMAVQREGLTAFDPGADTPVFPGDELMLLGTTEQLDRAGALLGEEVAGEAPAEAGFSMEQVVIGHDSPVAGETLAGSSVRRLFGVTVAGIQRLDTQHLSPGPDFVIKAGDILLVAGHIDAVTAFRAVAAGFKKD